MNANVFPSLRQATNYLHGSVSLAAIGLSLLLFACSPEPRYKTLPARHWLKQIRDPDATNRYHAAHALGEMGPSVQGALPALIQALDDPHTTVRWEAVKALAKFGPAAENAAPRLRQCLSDPEPSVRMAADVALKAIAKEPIPK
jgi:HEAT repeat protein